jgi:glycosyltransferase involved in cell wall biosynthesis
MDTSINLKEYPLVSILCLVFNAENFIENTLLSILNQDYKNYEIILSDDASLDKTVEIIKAISDLHPGKIKLYVNKENLGITKNCNLGLSLCNGKYIAFIAGDDLMYPGKITEQVKAMERNLDCSLCYHSIEVLDGDHNNQLIFTTEVKGQKYFSVFDLISRGGFIGCSSVMARMDSIPSGGFSNDFPIVSDWLMLIEIAFRGQIIKINGVYGAYLRHSNGASRKTFETLDEIVGTLNFLKRRYGYADEIENCTNKALNRYLLGEIARLFVSGDKARLNLLRKKYLFNKPSFNWLTILLSILINLKIQKSLIFRSIYKNISAYMK